ncbi:MAG: thioredoxin family protein [Sphingobacteriales bacterium]|nr:thioredoxin family protein [Sphingobacteriales bacterium]
MNTLNNYYPERMKGRIFIALLGTLLCVLPLAVQAQIFDPVEWSSEVQPLGNGEYVINITATLEKGWWTYSQHIAGDGPVPTKLSIEKNSDVEWNGKTEEVGKAEKSFDPNFEMELVKFQDKVTFKTRLKTKKPEVKVKADVEFMVCNKERCLPPNVVDFTFTLKDKTVVPASSNTKAEEKTEIKNKIPDTKPVFVPTSGSGGNTTTANKADGGKATFTPSTSDTKNATTNTATSQAQNGNTAFGQDNTTPTNTANNTAPSTTTDNVAAGSTEVGMPNGTMGQGGIFTPVHWSFSQEKISDNTVALLLTAKLDPGWYVYSQTVDGVGPVPTSFLFDPNPDISIEGKPEEISQHRKEGADPVFGGINIVKYSDEVVFKQMVRLNNPNATLNGKLRYMTCDDTKCLPPDSTTFSFKFGNGGAAAAIAETNTNSSDQAKTPWGIFFGGFAGGLFALLTPCVFPMIPLTVSLFTKRSKDRRKGIIDALIYAFSIIAIYVGLGFFVTAIFGPTALNDLATNAWVNIAFFIVFLFFAFSFFGYYEITMPSWLVNKSDAASDRGGLIGIFFMAFTLALTSFSCTGPIIGTLLVQAASTGSKAAPLLGMTGFALALAIPFGLFALFPGMLKNLPKSGGWLNTVKVVLGFIELALALKFLSNADLVMQWGLFKREPFMIIWIGLCLATAIYLLGWIRFPHDSPLKKLSLGRIGTALAFIAFAAYLVPGLFCQTPALISGFPPPITYSYRCGAAQVTNSHGKTEQSHCPHGLTCYHDYQEGIAAAKKMNKPVFIDFTGWACVNCRKMEETVWNQPSVLPKLRDEYVLISLYVDEKVELPAAQQVKYINYKGQEKTFRTVGEKWAHLQTSCFASNSQPYYVLLDHSENMLAAEPIGYTSTDDFEQYLSKGIDNFKAGKVEKTLSCAR